MAYTNLWNETTPVSSTIANTIASYWTNNMKAIRERIDDIFGTSGANSINTADPYKPFLLKLTGQADSYIIGGSISLALRANDGVTDNIKILDGGNIQFRALKFIPINVSYAFRDSTDSFDNINVVDSGLVTLRNTILTTAGGADFTGISYVRGQGIIPEYDTGNSGSALNIDWNNSNNQKVTLTAGCTLTFSNPLSAGVYFLRLIQDGVGGFTVSWPAVKWPSGTTPTLTVTAGKQDFISFYYDGVSYNGFVSGVNY